MRDEHDSNFSIDILQHKPFKRVVHSHVFPYIFQVAVLILFFVFLFNGLRTAGIDTSSRDFVSIFRKTNTTTLVVWGLWWPFLVVSTILLGQIWCIICPLELVSNVSRRLAARLGLKGMKMPRFVRTGFVVLLIYIALHLLVARYSIHRIPLYTSVMLIALLFAALLVGFVFSEPRAFCVGFCPARLLLNAYSRLSRVALRNKSDAVCQACQTKDCISEKYRNRWNGRSCPSYLLPFRLSEDDLCGNCFQCAKVCPNDNIGFGVVRRGCEKTRTTLPLSASIFVFIVAGFVAHEIFSEKPPMDRVFHTVPTALSGLFAGVLSFEFLEAVWFLFLIPAALCAFIILTNRLMNKGESVVDVLRRSATVLLPVAATGHAVKAVMKINSWSVYLSTSLRDPIGLNAAKQIVAGAMRKPHGLLPQPLLSAVGMLVIACVVVLCMSRARSRLTEGGWLPVWGACLAMAVIYSIPLIGLL